MFNNLVLFCVAKVGDKLISEYANGNIKIEVEKPSEGSGMSWLWVVGIIWVVLGVLCSK